MTPEEYMQSLRQQAHAGMPGMPVLNPELAAMIDAPQQPQQPQQPQLNFGPQPGMPPQMQPQPGMQMQPQPGLPPQPSAPVQRAPRQPKPNGDLAIAHAHIIAGCLRSGITDPNAIRFFMSLVQ